MANSADKFSTGYQGRTAIYELLPMNDEVRNRIITVVERNYGDTRIAIHSAT